MSDPRPYSVIMHNSITLDGSYINFEYTPELMELHYTIAANFGATFRLMGSRTCLHAIDLFGGLTDETREDFTKPQKNETLSYWVIPDSQGILMHKLHFFRQSEYCRDVIVLVSKHTPREYITYLESREYEYVISGDTQVDLDYSLAYLAKLYHVKKFLIDAGRGLTNAMINAGLVDTISLIIISKVLGVHTKNVFLDIMEPLTLHLANTQTFPGGYQWLLYDIER